MDGFGDDFVSAPVINDVDPAAEFLAREQDELGGLVDDISSPPILEATTSPDMIVESSSLDPMADDVASAPPAPDGFVVLGKDESTEVVDPVIQLQQPGRYDTPSPTPSMKREEPEKIKRWREEQKVRLETKDANEEKKKDELRDQAKKELDEWYKHHDEQIAKTRAANRSAEKQYVMDTEVAEPGQEWERIAKLCDFNPKASRGSKDVSRMRSIILQLKQAPPLKA